MKASSQESRMAVRAGESLGIRPSRTCGSSLGMGSDRCSNFIARSRNCSGVSIYPVSGPQSVPLQGPQNQAPSLNIIGSSQTGQFGGFSRGRARKASRSSSLSDSSATCGSYLSGESDNELDLEDRKSTRLNSSHSQISYAVFCLKKKKN